MFEKQNGNSYKSGEKSLTPKEYEKLIAVIPYLEHLLLIKLAVVSGIRREDIVKIKINDIDFEEGEIKYYEHKKKRLYSVYVDNDIIMLIKQHLNTLARKRDLLFSFGGRQAYNILNKYCEIAQIPKRPFHSLRATCIKFAQLKGWTPEQTAKHIGDRIATIQEHYSTPSKTEMAELAKTKPII